MWCGVVWYGVVWGNNVHAALLPVLLNFHTYIMLCECKFSCTSIHTSCYAAASSLALSYIRHATLPLVLMDFHTCVMLRCCKFSCTFIHTSRYAAASSLALPYMRHATLLQVLLDFHTYKSVHVHTSWKMIKKSLPTSLTTKDSKKP